MRTYRGSREGGIAVVAVEDDQGASFLPLDPAPSLAVRNHSPDGFNWGYQGSGPAQLALALLLDAGITRDTAEQVYQGFKRDVVAGWGDDWAITADAVREWVVNRLSGRVAS